MAQINRRPAAVRRAANVDPTRGASGSLAESYRSHIMGAPSEFRSSTFDPDTATLDALKGRSGEISKAMAPAPKELAFSDTGEIRDVFRQDDDIWEPGKAIPGEFEYDHSTLTPERGERAFDAESTAMNTWFGTPGGWAASSLPHDKMYEAFKRDTGFDLESHMFDKVPKMTEGKWIPGGTEIGKALTTGRILREHPDKFKKEGEAGGRFFGRTPAIKRRIDTDTAFTTMPKTAPYGTPGGMKFLDESSYLGLPDSDPFFRGV